MARYIYPCTVGEDGGSESVVQVSSLGWSASGVLYGRGRMLLGMGEMDEPMVVII